MITDTTTLKQAFAEMLEEYDAIGVIKNEGDLLLKAFANDDKAYSVIIDAIKTYELEDIEAILRNAVEFPFRLDIFALPFGWSHLKTFNVFLTAAVLAKEMRQKGWIVEVL